MNNVNSELYIVGTPIGNLQDFSPRAMEILNSCDLILAEDTRHSIYLLKNFDISTPLKSYHQHNESKRAHEIIELFNQSDNASSKIHKIALITDAGMPCISDPGYILVKLAQEHNIKVTVIPGPCAITSAIAISGIDCSKFCFEGFLSSKQQARLSSLEQLNTEYRAIVLYEAPHRLISCLSDIVTVMGADRLLAVIKELTKQYEQVTYGAAGQVLEKFLDLEKKQKIKGEYVIVISGSEAKINYKDQDILRALDVLKQENLSSKQAVKIISKLYDLNKNHVYDLAINNSQS